MLGTLVKSEQAGYGGLCGMCVERTTGEILINISDRGFYRSTDGAKTFKRLSETQPKGRTETPGCFVIDPTGKSEVMLAALVYGAPVSTCVDGIAWKPMNEKAAHVDWCAVDWTDSERKFVLALKHESGGMLIASRDGGISFSEIGDGYGPGWVFNSTTAVVAQDKSEHRPKPVLLRTEDAGVTWNACGDYRPVGNASAQALPRWHDGILFWVVEGKLIRSEDLGKTWETVCEIRAGHYGPVFGKTKDHMFVLTADGIVETNDGGASWLEAISVPHELNGVGLTWLDYDPKEGRLYLMRMGSELYQLTPARRTR